MYDSFYLCHVYFGVSQDEAKDYILQKTHLARLKATLRHQQTLSFVALVNVVHTRTGITLASQKLLAMPMQFSTSITLVQMAVVVQSHRAVGNLLTNVSIVVVEQAGRSWSASIERFRVWRLCDHESYSSARSSNHVGAMSKLSSIV